jgi:hypothetical protein
MPGRHPNINKNAAEVGGVLAILADQGRRARLDTRGRMRVPCGDGALVERRSATPLHGGRSPVVSSILQVECSRGDRSFAAVRIHVRQRALGSGIRGVAWLPPRRWITISERTVRGATQRNTAQHGATRRNTAQQTRAPARNEPTGLPGVRGGMCPNVPDCARMCHPAGQRILQNKATARMCPRRRAGVARRGYQSDCSSWTIAIASRSTFCCSPTKRPSPRVG